mmetsp:Transcript_29440/g.94546  ORF Transcript_29440/g.94546 Transcript_29440/m.94546 type:complete len:91 (+) Transcript_29440:420-692(+)
MSARSRNLQQRRHVAAPEATDMETLRFLNPETAREIAAKVGTPAYVYSEAELTTQAKTALAFPNAYGLTARYAMKSSPNAAILQVLDPRS